MGRSSQKCLQLIFVPGLLFLSRDIIAGFNTDTADVVAEVQAFLELSELFVALYVVEFGWVFRDGACRAEFDAFITVPAVFLQRMIGGEGEIGQDGYQSDPGAVLRSDQKIVPADSAQTRAPRDLLIDDPAPYLTKQVKHVLSNKD